MSYINKNFFFETIKNFFLFAWIDLGHFYKKISFLQILKKSFYEYTGASTKKIICGYKKKVSRKNGKFSCNYKKNFPANIKKFLRDYKKNFLATIKKSFSQFYFVLFYFWYI